jgi:hypothetical protein
MSFGLILRNLHNCPFVTVGFHNDVLAYPDSHASYPVPVRQFRLLPYRLLQCLGRPKPPCGLLMLPGVTPAHKGLTPSGLSFIQRTLLNLPFKAHTKAICNKGLSGNSSVLPRSNFGVGGQENSPQSLTAYSLNRYRRV